MKSKYIGKTVWVYQHYKDEPKHPFKAKILEDKGGPGGRWIAQYKNIDGVMITINVNKACCTTLR